jgi:predicted dehydrogenase
MSTLRWGIIGSGKIAHDFIKSMDKTERQHKVVAVAASSEEKAKKLIDDLKLDAKCYGYYQYLIADPDVDIVYIALYNEAHYHW